MKLRVLLAAVLALVAGGVAAKSMVQIQNSSSWAIHELYISPADVEEWGPDILGADVVPSGGTVNIHKVECDDYDVRLVDEDGDECIVGGVRLCADEAYELTDEDLLSCQAASR